MPLDLPGQPREGASVPGTDRSVGLLPGAPPGAESVLKRTFGPVWRSAVEAHPPPSSDRVGSKLHALGPPWPAQGGWPVLGQSQICPPPRSSAWSEDGPKTDLLACMEEGGAAFLGTNKARKPMEKVTLVPSSQKNDKVPKFAVGSKLHALGPPWPAQGGWPVLGQSQICPPPRSSAWSEDGPKTDLLACMEEGGAAFLGTNKARKPMEKGTLVPSSQKMTKSQNLQWVQSSMLSDLPGRPREGGPSWVRVRFARHPGAPPGAKTVLKRTFWHVWRRVERPSWARIKPESPWRKELWCQALKK
ncbi:hypothetical protein PO909_012886 [Leuciscus waleckii]